LETRTISEREHDAVDCMLENIDKCAVSKKIFWYCEPSPELMEGGYLRPLDQWDQ
jgi:hypothetical protein